MATTQLRVLTGLAAFLVCSSLVRVSLGADEPAEKHPDVGYAEKQVQLTFGDEQWLVAPVKDAKGLSITRLRDGTKHTFTIDADPSLGTVTDLVAQGFNYGGGRYGIAIGVASKDTTGTKADYQIVWGYGLSDELIDAKRWKFSGPLLAAQADDPFQAMSISVSHGDSVMFSIQRMKRRGQTKSDQTEIETHVFVHHCAVALDASFAKQMTQHYTTVFDTPSATSGFMQPVDPKNHGRPGLNLSE